MLGQDKLWKINIDKKTRIEEERDEAEDMLGTVGDMDYEKMFQKQKKDQAG